MMIISRRNAKRRHALLWLFILLFAPFALLTANFSWPRREKTSVSKA